MDQYKKTVGIIGKIAGVAVLILGVTVLAGWCLQIQTLTRLFSSGPPTSPVTALGFILGGISLLCLDLGRGDAGLDALRIVSIVEWADDAIIANDLNRVITAWNRGAEKLFGYAAREILGQPVSRLIPPEHQPEEQRILEQVASGGSPQHFEIMGKTKEGRLVDLEFTVSPVKNSNGQVVGVSQIARDVSARRQAQLDSQRLAGIVEWSEDAIVGCGLDSIITNWNKGAEKMFGYRPAEIIGQSFVRLIPADRRDEEARILGKIKAGQTLDHFETLRQTKDGRLIEVSVTLSPIKDFAGRITGLSGIVREIGQRRKIESDARHLAAIVDSSADAIIGRDLDGIITSWNPAAERIFGYSAQEMIGASILRVIPPERHEEESLILTRIKQGRSMEHFETQRLTKGGQLIDVSVSVSPIKDSAGKITGVSKTAHVMTDQKRAEKDAFRLAAIVNSSEDAIIGKDLENNITSWNRGAEKIFGYSAAEMIGTSIMRLIPADREDEENQILADINAGKSTPPFETRRRTKDGRLIDLSIAASPIKDAGGKIIGVSKIARDITAQKKAVMDSLRLAALVASSGDAIIGKGLDTIITSWNRGAERLFGYTAAEMIGTSIMRLIPADREEEEKLILDKIAQDKMVDHFETVRQMKGGRLIEVSVTASPIKDATGKIIGVSKIARDITQRKNAEKALNEAMRFAQHTIDALPAHICVLDESGKIIAANTAWRQFPELNSFSGIGTQVGSNYLEVCDRVIGKDREEARAFAQGIRDVLRNTSSEFSMEYACPAPGENRWFVGRITKFPHPGEVRVVISHENITVRKQAERELQRKTTFLEAQVNSSPDAILVVDSQKRKVLQNQRLIDLFQVPRDIEDNPNDGRLLQYVVGLMKHPEQFLERVQWLYDHPDEIGMDEIELVGGKVLERYSSPMKDASGKYYGRIWTFRDITERQKTTAAIQNQLNELQRWHEAMLDREDRILGLKREVNELLTRLQLPVRYHSTGNK